MKDLFHTIEGPSQGQYREKGSRFLAFAYPVSDEEEIKEWIKHQKKEYHDARHHCFAWRLGADMERYRVNDDGEPSGSAGKPIFGQIQSRELTELLVIVVRYFGGTLLGVGGLINAYRSAASAALDEATILKKKVEERLILSYTYEATNQVMKVLSDFDLGIENQQFDLKCSMILKVWKRHLPQVSERFRSIEGCSLQWNRERKL